MQIGRISIDPVIDGYIVTDTEYAYPPIPRERWAPHIDLLTPDGRVFNHVGGFLVRDGERTMLVDTGVGPDGPPVFVAGGLLSSLHALGVRPEDVTDVVFTHLHFDHVGWATVDGAITFENAKHVANRTDWEYFFSGRYPGTRVERPHDFPAVRLEPLTDRILLWTSEHELTPSLHLRLAAGHTPGHAVIEIESDGKRAMLIGDLAHHQVELLEDNWTGVADLDPEQARRSALAVGSELAADGRPFAAAHFPGMVWGTLEQTSAGTRRWTPLEPERFRASLHGTGTR